MSEVTTCATAEPAHDVKGVFRQPPQDHRPHHQNRTWWDLSDTGQAAKQHECLEWLTWLSCNHKIVKLDTRHDLLQDRNCKVCYVSESLQCKHCQARGQVPAAGYRAEGKAMLQLGRSSDQKWRGGCNSSNAIWGSLDASSRLSDTQCVPVMQSCQAPVWRRACTGKCFQRCRVYMATMTVCQSCCNISQV